MALDERPTVLGSLITSILSLNSQEGEDEFLSIRNHALKSLKDFKGPRTNQFAIADRLEGLSERAEIFGRDDLAASLRDHVAKAQDLPHKFMPEFLSLLLDLSDHPIEETSVDALDNVHRGSNEVPLSWADILRDDPFDNSEGLWDNVDFAEESSINDEDDVRFVSESPEGTLASTIETTSQTDGFQREFELKLRTKDLDGLKKLRSEWKEIKESSSPSVANPSERQIIREVISMLRGYETDLFVASADNVSPREHVRIQTLSHKPMYDILTQFASLGMRLSHIRSQVRGSSPDPVIQTFQSALEQELRKLDECLSEVEGKCIESFGPFTLLDLLSEIRLACKNLVPLGELLKVEGSNGSAAIKVLDSLYEYTCMKQNLGDVHGYGLSAKIFEESFDTYLRPIREWILFGELDSGNSSFFIQSAAGSSITSTHRAPEFDIVYDEKEMLYAPLVLRNFATKILTTGKSIRFLKALGREPRKPTANQFVLDTTEDPRSRELMPFGRVIEHSLEQWIQPIYLQTSILICNALSTCGLPETMSALQALFLGQNGPALDIIADAFLKRIEQSPSALCDPLTVIGIYHEAFSSPDCIDEDKISIQTHPSDVATPLKLSRLLETLEVSYKMPWVASNIVRSETISTYRRVHKTLLQLRIAKRAIDEKFHHKMIRHGSGSSQSSNLGLRLSHRLRWFVHTMESYYLGIALQNPILDIRGTLDEPGDIDTKLQAHDAFIAITQRRFLLKSQAARTQQAILSILDLTLVAATYLQSQWQLMYAHKSNNGEPEQGETSPAADQQRSERLEGYVSTYTKFLGFVHIGVLETARVEGDKCLQMLADSLAFGLKPSKGEN